MNKYYKVAILLVAMVLAINVIACADPPDPPVPTAQPLNEAVTEAAEDTLETAEEGQSAICKACLLANGDDCSQCSGVCVCPSE